MSIKVLCLDGGGYRGKLTTLMLMRLERKIHEICKGNGRPQRSLSEYFDLIVGTSTGRLIAAALRIGKTIDQVNEMFEEDGKVLFPRRSKIDLFFRAPSGPICKGSDLDTVLEKHLGDIRFGDIQKERGLAITAYDSWNNRPIIFRNYDESCEKIMIRDGCRGSSAYPAGFASHRLQDNVDNNSFLQRLRESRSYFSLDHTCKGRDGIPLIDGGIGANNPSAVALAQVLGDYGAMTKDKSNTEVSEKPLIASFGTGQMPPCINSEKSAKYSIKEWGWLFGNPLLEMMFVGYSRVTDDICRNVIGEDNYFRFQPVLLWDKIDDQASNSNSIVMITDEQKNLFSTATFQADKSVNDLFKSICDDFFDTNLIEEMSTPTDDLCRLAARLAIDA